MPTCRGEMVRTLGEAIKRINWGADINRWIGIHYEVETERYFSTPQETPESIKAKGMEKLREALEQDNVNHPQHYTDHPSGIECIEVTEHMNFCLGNAVKYLFRLDKKHADLVLDLEKALWYVRRHGKYMENLSSRHSLRSFFSGADKNDIDETITESSANKEWLYDRNVFLSSDSPLFAQDCLRDLPRGLPKGEGGIPSGWGQVEQFNFKSGMGISERESQSESASQHLSARCKESCRKTKRQSRGGNFINQLERVISSENWEDIRSITFDNRSDIKERVLAISKYIGIADDNVTRAVFYIWRADLKDDAIEDLKKAIWYINREIERRLK
jgi:hypothetical protein